MTDEKKNEVLEQLLKGAIEVLPNSENGRIASLLYSEGYCEHTGGYGDKNRYKITGKGIDFITNGGYIGQTAIKNEEAKQKKWERLLGWVSKFAGVILGALLNLLHGCFK